MNSSAVSKDTASVPDIYPRDLIRMTDSLLRGELRDPHLGSGHPFRSIAVAEDMTEQQLKTEKLRLLRELREMENEIA